LAAGAIRAYIGLGAAVVDMGLGFVNWLYVPTSTKTRTPVAPPAERDLDWAGILYYGDRRLARDLRGRGDRRRRVRPRRR
ncbi:MAG: glycosyltransferase, partial [Nocardioidaceae bacterium]|nr:glycosyltransferase [Nocardioidaceae bacterium]